MKKNATIFVFLCLGAPLGFGQTDWVTAQQMAERDKVYAEANDRSRQPEQTQRVPSGLPKTIKKLSKEDKIKLAPPKETVEKYAHFLKGKNTGIVKLIPFPNCDRRVVNINDLTCLEAPQIAGNDSFYSFSERSHLFKKSFEIILNDEKFYGRPSNLTLFTELGDVSLEDFSFLDEIKNLKNFKINNQSQLFEQQKKLANGLELGGRLYTNKVSVKLNTTYLFHSVRYDWRRNNFDEVTVALRVIGYEPTGSAVFIWKKF